MNNCRWVSRVTNASDGLQSGGLQAGRREFARFASGREPRAKMTFHLLGGIRGGRCGARVFITRTNGDRAACACIGARITVHNAREAQERRDNANE